MAPNDVKPETEDEAWKNMLDQATRFKRDKIRPGDTVRVQLKRKTFDRGYNKPRYSKDVYTVNRIEKIGDNKYYVINGLNRKYLRSFIEKVGVVERNIEPADLEGTREGHLRDLAKQKSESLPIPEEIQETSIAAPRRSQRVRKTRDFLTYS